MNFIRMMMYKLIEIEKNMKDLLIKQIGKCLQNTKDHSIYLQDNQISLDSISQQVIPKGLTLRDVGKKQVVMLIANHPDFRQCLEFGFNTLITSDESNNYTMNILIDALSIEDILKLCRLEDRNNEINKKLKECLEKEKIYDKIIQDLRNQIEELKSKKTCRKDTKK